MKQLVVLAAAWAAVGCAPSGQVAAQAGAEGGAAATDLGSRPALVVGLTVDQMRMDYLYRFWPYFGEGGFRRLVEGGFLCADHHFGYAPTFTGPGHASIFTGTTPSVHGIIGNDWYDRASGVNVYCAADTSVRGVGTADPLDAEGRMSPHRMRTTTLGDELKLAFGRRPKVIGISLKDRGAILPAGHAADAAYWFVGKDLGAFVTSTHYMDRLPDWAARWNAASPAQRLLDAGWSPLLPDSAYGVSWPDNTPYEGKFKGGVRAAFPYDLKALAAANKGFDLLKATPGGNTLLVDFALAAVAGEGLGRDVWTDLLAVSFSTPDYVGHQFGPHAWETQDIYVRLDAELARLFAGLDAAVGAGQWTCFLTADHAGATVPSLAASEGIPADYWKPGNLRDRIDSTLQAVHGPGDWLLSYSNDQIFLNRPLIAQRGLSLAALQRSVAEWAQLEPSIHAAYAAADLVAGSGPDAVVDRLRLGHQPVLSGDVVVVPLPGWIDYGRTGTTHGSPFAYDTHVPCIFYGWGVEPGVTYERTHIHDIAPTVSALIHSPLPSGTTGAVIEDLFD
jgi:hypothetical protein